MEPIHRDASKAGRSDHRDRRGGGVKQKYLFKRFVYAARAVSGEGPIKIGCSKEPRQRLLKLMDYSPVPLELLASVPGNYGDEFALQTLLMAHHSHFEWFHPTPEVLDVVERMRAGTIDLSTLPRRNRGLGTSLKYVELPSEAA